MEQQRWCATRALVPGQDGPPVSIRPRAAVLAACAVVALLQMSDSKLSTTDFERLAAAVRKTNLEGR